MKRRALLAGTAAASIVGVSGCLSGVLGTVTSLESAPAGVSGSALDSTGYEAVGIEKIVTEETADAPGQSETISVTSYLTRYDKRVGIDGVGEQPTAIFAVLSTPQLEVAGETFNPVGEMPAREVADLLADNYDNIGSIQPDNEETITILDQSTLKSRFTAEADFFGFPLKLDVHVTEAVQRGEDFLVSLGVYPRLVRAIEGENARALAESITPEPTTAEAANESEPTSESNDESTSDDTSENQSTSDDTNATDFGGTESGGLLGVTDLS